MISRELKILFYILLTIPLAISGWLYRVFFAPRKGTAMVQLGPGKRNYIKGWINVDANFISAKSDCIADFRRSLPFHDNSIDGIYSINVIEHIPDLDFHFKEVYRCLKPGGKFRIGGPNGDAHIAKFIAGDLEWFSTFPDVRNSVGGRFSNYLIMRGEHLHILTRSYVEELAGNAGFKEFAVCCPVVETTFGDFFKEAMATESHEADPKFPKAFLVESTKPL